ncbi:MAG: hypothetical protein NTX42_03890 [Methanothrix sp.]|nr:hypothetical protein [Methanothrix sp.]
MPTNALAGPGHLPGMRPQARRLGSTWARRGSGRGDLDFPLVSAALLVVHFHNGHDLPHAQNWAHESGAE